MGCLKEAGETRKGIDEGKLSLMRDETCWFWKERKTELHVSDCASD